MSEPGRGWGWWIRIRPRPLLVGALLSWLVALVLLSRAHFAGDLTDLLPKDSPAAKAWNGYRRYFDRGDQLVIAVFREEGREGESPRGRESEPTAPSAWAHELQSDLASLADVRRVEVGLFSGWQDFAEQVLAHAGFLYLKPEQARELVARLGEDGMREGLARSMALLESSPGLDTVDVVRRDPLFLREVLAGGAAPWPGGGLLGGDEPDDLALVVITGTRPAQDLPYSRALVTAVETVVTAHPAPGLRVRMTGGYAIAVEDERRIRGDLEATTVTSGLLVSVLFLLAFRGVLPLLVMLGTLLTGILWGYAVFVSITGGITLLTAVGGAVLIGLGVDFGIHLYAEFLRARQQGHEPPQAARLMLEHAGPRILVAGCTSILCFSAFAWTGFRGLSELGLLAAIGLFTTLLAFLLFTPVLLPRIRTRSLAAPLEVLTRRLWELPLRHPGFTVGISALGGLGAGAVLLTRGVPPFEPDLRMLHQDQSEALQVLEELDAKTDRPFVPWMLVTEGARIDEVLVRFEQAERLLRPLVEDGVLHSFELPQRLLPPRAAQEEVLRILKTRSGAVVEEQFLRLADEQGFDPEEFAATARGLRRNLDRSEPLGIAELEARGGGELLGSFLRPTDGGWMAAGYLFPYGGPFAATRSADTLARVEDALRPAPELVLTGFPVVAAELSAQVEGDFRQVTLLAVLAVVALIALTCRSLVDTALALIPVAMGLLWLLATMRLMDSPFNVMNVVIFPMIVGLGIDDGVHLIFEWRRERDLEKALRAVILPVVLTTLTTIAGFGSLALVEHPAIASMGELAGGGALCCLLATVFLLPALLHLRDRRGRFRAGD